MSSNPRSLPARLRRHRGLWVLAFAVLLIKLATGTACLADGLHLQPVAPAGSALLQPTVHAAPAMDGASDPCVLGEGGTCHCACPESVPVPASAVRWLASGTTRFIPPALDPGIRPLFVGPLLRPPIA